MDVPTVRNPYEHINAARAAEKEGNIRRAESEWKAAVIAADSLPLLEYKRNYKEELVRYSFDPDYESQPGVSERRLREVYGELLGLPFTTRVHLATFYARNGAHAEAHEICEQAFAYGIDALAKEHSAMLEFFKRAEIVRNTLMQKVGPAALPQIFEKHFENLDKDGDGFVHEKELQEAQFDLTLPADCQLVIRYLLENYEEVEAAHHDEWGLPDARGISRKDVQVHQSEKNKNWKRMRK